LAQGSIVVVPIRHLVLLLGDVIATLLVQLDWQSGYPVSEEGQTFYARPVAGIIG
jgi:hypothetical protein